MRAAAQRIVPIALLGAAAAYMVARLIQADHIGFLALDYKLAAAQRLVDGHTLYPTSGPGFGDYPYPPIWAMVTTPLLVLPHAAEVVRGGSRSNVRKNTVQRPRHVAEIERLDEQSRVVDLPAAAGAHEAPKLGFGGQPSPGRLVLQSAKRSQVSLSADNPFDGGGSEGADQLILEICVAHVETEAFRVGAAEMSAEAGALEGAPEVVLLRGVAEARQSDVQPSRAETFQRVSDPLGTADRHDGHALIGKIPPTALGHRFERALVADPFDEHDRTPGPHVTDSPRRTC